jgi:hypothetical protein
MERTNRTVDQDGLVLVVFGIHVHLDIQDCELQSLDRQSSRANALKDKDGQSGHLQFEKIYMKSESQFLKRERLYNHLNVGRTAEEWTP